MSIELSFRAALRSARSPAADGAVSFRDLKAIWKSGGAARLRENMQRMLIDPKMSTWSVVGEGVFENHVWTNHCQGVACDGAFWYVAQDDGGDDRGIFKFPLDFSGEVKRWRPGQQWGQHVGDIDCGLYKGKECIFAPYEETPTGIGRAVILDKDLNVVDSAYLKGADGGAPPTGPKAPWFAYHRGNGLLYTSVYDHARTLEAYDPEREFRHVPAASIVLDREIHQVQGGAFNGSGHVFVSQMARAEIVGFSAFTGAFLGSVPFAMSYGGLDYELAEGLCWAPLQVGNVRTSLHFVLLDMDLTGDDIFLKHFATGDIA